MSFKLLGSRPKFQRFGGEHSPVVQEDFVVLAEQPGRFQPFVTWRSKHMTGLSPSGEPEVFWGHYFKDLSAATADFLSR